MPPVSVGLAWDHCAGVAGAKGVKVADIGYVESLPLVELGVARLARVGGASVVGLYPG